jgi:large subunit ribosomal protein L4
MLKIKVYNQEGKEVGEEKLDPAVFGVKVKPELVHQAVVAQMAKARVPIAHTKTRGEVRGGGKKPWRQKGTGRARVGSTRSPIWRGGGITFGPRKNRVFAQKINKKARRKALLMCLSDKKASGWMVVLNKLELGKGKTKELVKVLESLGNLIKSSKSKVKSSELKVKNKEIKKQKDKKIKGQKNSILVILVDKDDNVVRAARNIPRVATIRVDSLNVVDLLKYKYLLVTKEGVKRIVKLFHG